MSTSDIAKIVRKKSPPMNTTEARQQVQQIARGVENMELAYRDTAERILALDAREGWRALGYDSLADCMQDELGMAKTRVYQLCAYARTVNVIEAAPVHRGGLSQLTERSVRPLTKIREPDQQVEAFKIAVRLAEQENDEAPVVTERHMRAAVQELTGGGANGPSSTAALVACPTCKGKGKVPAADKSGIGWTAGSGWVGITDEDRARWADAYPAVNVARQLAAAHEWLLANPKKAKKSNWRRFVTGWLSRSQDRGGDEKSNRPGAVRLNPVTGEPME